MRVLGGKEKVQDRRRLTPLGVVADAVFEDGLHSLDVVDALGPVTGKDHQIRSLSGRYGSERRQSFKSPVQRRLRAPMSSAAGALRSSTVQQCVIPDT